MRKKKKIDYEKCVGCLKCVEDCVNQYIIVADAGGVKPQGKPVFKERGRCLDCGHCEAICPQGAISSVDFTEEYTEDDMLHLMAMKRTIRKYIKDDPIKQYDLERLIYAAQTAPTDRNRRSARLLLVKEKLKEVYNMSLDYLVSEVQKTGTINPLYTPTMNMAANRDNVLWGAEYLVVFVGNDGMLADSLIAAERMQLEAEKLGLGTAYRGDIKKAINEVVDIRRLLNMTDRENALVTFALGKSAVRYYRPAVKNNRTVEFM